MLTTAKLKSYRIAELLEFLAGTIEIIDRSELTVLDSAKSDLIEAYKTLDDSFKVSQGSRITETVQTLDARRDDAIMGVAQLVKAFTYHFRPELAAAAKLMQKEINKYGVNIAKLNYQAQTAAIKSLLQDFENDGELRAAVSILQLTEWLTELKTANDAFATAYINRVADVVDKKVPPVSDLRPAAHAAFDKLKQHLQANTVLNPSKTLNTVVAQLNELIQKYNALS
jgi:hypothetical protein